MYKGFAGGFSLCAQTGANLCAFSATLFFPDEVALNGTTVFSLYLFIYLFYVTNVTHPDT